VEFTIVYGKLFEYLGIVLWEVCSQCIPITLCVAAPYGRREYDVIIAQCHITSTIDNYGSVKLEGVPVGDTPVRNTQLI